MIQVDSLVRAQNVSTGDSPHQDLGIGKVTQIADREAVVEYFCSIGQRIEKTLPLSSLSQVQLQRQTRCYIALDGQNWTSGRIYEWDDDNCQYLIDLPDKKTVFAPEKQIYVRCNIPIEDPIEILAMKGQDTPYFHERRFAFVKSLISQRAVSHGITGLISANIKLYPHQVEVVRRVLEDPIQKYLLADEVGLGKTIEAGAIVRQYLLDETQGKALVLVPQYLLEQWRKELETKFYISHFPDRVVLLAVEDVHKVNPKANINFLIIDEAHNVAAMASSTEATQQQCFERCKNLAHKSDRLLLLSATPVVNHEQDFLAMLHLLDPTTYKLDDLEGFRVRVTKSQEIGRILLAFKEGVEPAVIKANLEQLGNQFAEDEYLLQLALEVQNNLEAKNAKIDKSIVAIRTHISDTYRLHRRMLRNRRASVEDVIFDRNITPKVEYDLDERSYDVHELIEEWRKSAPNEQQYRSIFLLIFRGAGTWLGILEQLITARLQSTSSPELIREFGRESIGVLTKTAKFAGEEAILQSLLKLIKQPSEDGDRIELLKIVLLYSLSDRFKLQSFKGNLPRLLEEVQRRIKRPIPGDTLPKVVVFTSYTQVGAEIYRSLTDSFGQGTVANHLLGKTRAEVEKSFNQFQKDPNCFILVCDSSGEEGRNLQFADWMIHFDLPWSPNRLEQRIGRIDRIGRSLQVDFTVFAGSDLDDSLHDAWYRLLKDGFNIFGQSIASLQFYVDSKLSTLEETLLNSGANGLAEATIQIQQEITSEQAKINEQNALDEIDAFDENASQYFQHLDDYDARHQEIQRGTEDWICDALRFKPITNPNISGVKRYKPIDKTLIAADDMSRIFAGALEEFGTFDRRIANQHPNVKLHRIGEELVDALSSYIHWDDRGQAFAMWRVEETYNAKEGEEWFGFRFNYTIETDLAKYTENSTKFKALQRRADGLFPPIVESLFIDARQEPMQVVEDKALLNILQRPYLSKGLRNRDFNIAKNRLSILDNFVDANKWQDFCRQARSTSLELLNQRPAFVKLCEQSALRAEQKLGQRLQQLRLRLNRFTKQGQSHILLAKELHNETILNQAIIEGIRNPQIRLDSVGFIIVSGRTPAQFDEDD